MPSTSPQRRLQFLAGICALLCIALIAGALRMHWRKEHLRETAGVMFDHDGEWEPQTGNVQVDNVLGASAQILSDTLPPKSVHLDRPQNEDVLTLRGFPGLERLSICAGPVDASGLQVLEHLTHLREFTLSGCDQATDEALTHLRHCSELKRISITETADVAGSFLDELTCEHELQEVEIWVGVAFDDDRLRSLERFQKLQRIYIEGGAFDGSGFTVFRKLPQLKQLEIRVPSEFAASQVSHVPEVTRLEGSLR